MRLSGPHEPYEADCGGCYNNDWPRPCRCGGLVHAEFEAQTWDGYSLRCECDRCGGKYDIIGTPTHPVWDEEEPSWPPPLKKGS